MRRPGPHVHGDPLRRCRATPPTGKLTVYHSNQSPYYMQGLMAGVLGLREGDIRVISHYVGGGFGGKFELDGAIFCSAVLSMKVLQTGQDRLHEGRRLHRHEAPDPDVLLRADRRQKGRHLLRPGSQGLHERRRVHRHGRDGPLSHRFLPLLPVPMEEATAMTATGSIRTPFLPPPCAVSALPRPCSVPSSRSNGLPPTSASTRSR